MIIGVIPSAREAFSNGVFMVVVEPLPQTWRGGRKEGQEEGDQEEHGKGNEGRKRKKRTVEAASLSPFKH